MFWHDRSKGWRGLLDRGELNCACRRGLKPFFALRQCSAPEAEHKLRSARFVVVVPPIGIVIPLLPPSYATLWIGGAPYYNANGVYYAPAGPDGYRVVAPPPQAEQVQPVPPAPAPKALPEPIYYPRNAQAAAQTEIDRQDCNRWATTQANAMADATVFQRAVAACMDGRGYPVR